MGTIVVDPLVAGVFDVIGTHVYASPTLVAIPNTVSVSVSDQWGGKTAITNNMTVTSTALTFTKLALPTNPATPIIAGKAFTSDVSLFTSANPNATANLYSASISWGDGTSSSAAIEPSGANTIDVVGTHKYAQPGSYAMAVTLSDAQGNTVTNSRTAVVSAPPAPAAVPLATVTTTMNKHHQVVQLVLSWIAAVDSAQAQSLKSNRLVAPGKGGSFTAPGARTIHRCGSAVYDSATDSVLLTATKPFVVRKPIELFVGGKARATISNTRVQLVSAAAAPSAITASRQRIALAATTRSVGERPSTNKLTSPGGVLVDAPAKNGIPSPTSSAKFPPAQRLNSRALERFILSNVIRPCPMPLNLTAVFAYLS